MKRWIFWSLILLVQQICFGQTAQDLWVDKTYDAMSTEERVAQLIMIRAFSKEDPKEIAHVKKLISKYKVGGICFFQGTPVKQTQLINDYQRLAKIPLLTSIDGEWGLGMRFPKKAFSFPKQLTLGAIQDNSLIYEMGKEVAKHCKKTGIHINFAPVVDVNNNPNNPVINDRSFGENKYNVIAKSYAYMKGMQDEGVLACAKHFPGHGDTDVDSHLDLPVIMHDRARLDSVELVPFRAMISQGIASMMIAHLHIPSIDDRPNRPTTLSRKAITGLLREEMAFNGLIFTDAMEMKGVTKHFSPGEADAEAFLAGADIILLPEDTPKAIAAITKYVRDGKVPYSQLEQSVKRILRTKYALGLNEQRPLPISGISAYVNRKEAQILEEKLVENAITLVKDPQSIVPIRDLNKRIVSIAVGSKHQTNFQKMVQNYVDARELYINKKPSAAQQKEIDKVVKDADKVIVSFHDMSKYASKKHGIDPTAVTWVKNLAKEKDVIIVLFGSPYAVKYFEDVEDAILVSYDEKKVYQEKTAQCLFGAKPFKGRLPISPCSSIPYGQGIYRPDLGRLGFSIPERVGINSSKLAALDSLAKDMIAKKASPGAQIVVVKDNEVVLMKSYGKPTYRSKSNITEKSIYDMASVTKICATTLSVMKLYEEGKIDLKAPLLRYIPETNTTNKATLKIDAILAHHAQLKPWIPFYKTTVHDSKRAPHPIDTIYARSYRPPYTIPVTDRLYLREDYRDTIWNRIYDSELRAKQGYRYSDLGLYLMAKSIYNITGQHVDEYAMQAFYHPLGLHRTGYKPLQAHDIEEIVPSERDGYFRDQLLQGYVHDMGAAMLGGVSGHAGLFSTAYETAIILQMLLNGGSYGGKSYLKPETIKKFTTRYANSTRRGLGFDMKELNESRTLNMGDLAPASTFGHLGFTGIAAFADPENNLIFVMTANRTFPTMENRRYIKNDYRPKAQNIVYQALDQGITSL